MNDDHPVVLFDGICNFCNGMINYIIKQDKKKIFRFATLQSAAGQELLKKFNLPTENFDSFILIDKEEVYKSSTAGIKVFNKLSWYWKWTQILRIVPKFLRDAAYNLIARKRYKWFGKKEECMMPSPELRSRFLS